MRSRKDTSKKLALYGHDSCGTAFITELREGISVKYTGTCPNPRCNSHVVLVPAEVYSSVDKARRVYIRKVKSEGEPIYWQPDVLAA
jgi:hypothetical protein